MIERTARTKESAPGGARGGRSGASRALVLAPVLVLVAAAAHTVTAAPVAIADGALGAPGARVPPNVLLNLSLTYQAAAAAYPGANDYDRARDYAGYFDARMCYRYPTVRGAGGVAGPDLSEAAGYFSVSKAADALHECGGDAFSGNFMNWAATSTLDLLRYGLSGGDRVIDTAGLTVLQRAYLPDGRAHADFYAHPVFFPRKLVGRGSAIASSAPARVTPFAAATVYIVSCRDRILFSDTRDGGACDAARTAGSPPAPLRSDKALGEYRARVQVCGDAEGPIRAELCMRHGARYKPAGAVQRFAERLRVGVFGYLTERGAGEVNWYGGALRAALAEPGPERRGAGGFGVAPNPGAEWDGATGVLRGDAGALNYLNRLGRSAPERLGAYKADAPLSEQYYEALRYVQGRQPSAAAAAVAGDDRLPVVPVWADPLTAPCQRQIILTIANADAAYDRYVPGNTRTDYLDAARPVDHFSRPAPLDAMAWTRRVGEMEADAGGLYGNPAPRPGLRALDVLDTGADGRAAYYLAGLAHWAHVNPVRADWPGRVDNAVLDLDAGGNGALDDGSPRAVKPRDSQLYLAAKYGGFDDRNLDGNPFRTSGTAGADGRAPLRDDAEWSAAGRDPGQYFLGGDAAGVIRALRAMVAAAVRPRGVRAGPSLLVPGAAGSSAAWFQSTVDLADGSASLTRTPVTRGAGGAPRLAAPIWDAGALLTGAPARHPPVPPHPAPSQRRLFTLRAAPDKSVRTVPFLWGELAEAHKAALDTSPVTKQADGLGALRVDYLRGERGREIGRPGGVFRRRSGVLGDAVRSAPVYVGAPSPGVQGADYGAFYARHRMRPAVLYQGANDGMLHAFDAGDGHEWFAYLPAALLPSLNQLTDVGYRHRAYVDGGVAVAEASVNGQWRTVLAASFGGGARGVFALDVTDPARFERGGALWEFTDLDDPAIGNLLAAPSIAKLRVKGSAAAAEYRHFVVVPSGVNNDVDDGKGRFVAGGVGALFLLALDKPAGAPWQLGVNYYKLSVPGAVNGLGPPALALGPGGVARYAYAGDLQGNLWRFDFAGNPPWPAALGAPGQPLFVARDGDGRRQPITQQPALAFGRGGGYLVLFGTGQWIGEDDLDPAGFAPQSFYALEDGVAGAAPAAGRAGLARRTLSGAEGAAAFAVSGEDMADAAAAGRRGWFVDFPHAASTGERSVTRPALAGGTVFFHTTLPGRDGCAAPRYRSYALGVLDGLPSDGGASPGGLMSGQLRDAAPTLLPAALSVAGGAQGSATATQQVVSLGGGAAPGADGVVATLVRMVGRIGWREIGNWRELHEAATK